MAWKDWVRRKNRELHRKSLEDRDSRLWHSSAYHSYFEGYTEYKTTDERGKTKIKRVYTGAWHVQELQGARYVLLRVLYILMFLGMVGAIVIAGMNQGSAGTAFYIVLPEIVTVCLLARLFYVLFVNYLFAARKMTIHDFRSSSVALKSATLWLAIVFLTDVGFTLLDYALNLGNPESRFVSFALTVFAFLCGAVLAGIMGLMERKISYKELPNQEQRQAGGITIDNEESEGLVG